MTHIDFIHLCQKEQAKHAEYILSEMEGKHRKRDAKKQAEVFVESMHSLVRYKLVHISRSGKGVVYCRWLIFDFENMEFDVCFGSFKHLDVDGMVNVIKSNYEVMFERDNVEYFFYQNLMLVYADYGNEIKIIPN